jgi:hypothetical protein
MKHLLSSISSLASFVKSIESCQQKNIEIKQQQQKPVDVPEFPCANDSVAAPTFTDDRNDQKDVETIIAAAYALQTVALALAKISHRYHALDLDAITIEYNRMHTYIADKLQQMQKSINPPKLNIPATNRIIKHALWEDA